MDREQSKTVMVLQQLLRGNQAHFLSISGGAWAANTIIPHPCPSFKASILGLGFRPRDGLLTDLSALTDLCSYLYFKNGVVMICDNWIMIFSDIHSQQVFLII